MTIAFIKKPELLWESPGFSMVKGLDSEFFAVSRRVGDLMGVQSVEEALKHNDYSLPVKASEFADGFVQQDLDCLQTESTIQTLDIHTYFGDEVVSYLGEKSPIYHENKLIGVFCQTIEIDTAFFHRIIHNFYQHDCQRYGVSKDNASYQIVEEYDTFDLSERESQCLYYLIRGGSMKSIAQHLAISPRTVEQHIYNIRAKTQTQTTEALIEKSLSVGLLGMLPKVVLRHP